MSIWPRIHVIGYGDNPRIAALVLANDIRDAVFNKWQTLQIRPMPCVETCVDGNIKKRQPLQTCLL